MNINSNSTTNSINTNIINENKKLKEELNIYKKENENLQNKINKLKNDNNKLNNELINANKIISKFNNNQNNNIDINNKINNLNEMLKMKDNIINDLKKQLENKEHNNLKSQLIQNNNQNNNETIELYKRIDELNKRIDELNKKLKRYPINLEENEKLMSVIFTSTDQKAHYSIICKNTDTIHNLENELYNEYPEYSETDNYFLCKGQVINKFKTLEVNHIKNGDIILLNKRD